MLLMWRIISSPKHILERKFKKRKLKIQLSLTMSRKALAVINIRNWRGAALRSYSVAADKDKGSSLEQATSDYPSTAELIGTSTYVYCTLRRAQIISLTV